MKRYLTISLFHALNSLRNLVGGGAGVAPSTDVLADDSLFQVATPSLITQLATLLPNCLRPWSFRSAVADFGVGYCDRIAQRSLAIAAHGERWMANCMANQSVKAAVERFASDDRVGVVHPITPKPSPNPIPRSGRYGCQLAIST